MAGGDDPSASSSSARPEQKSLSEDKALASYDDTPSTDSDQEFVDARERSGSVSTQRSLFFDTQRTDVRPGSAAGLSASRAKGKERNVDLREPTESSVTAVSPSTQRTTTTQVDSSRSPDPSTTSTALRTGGGAASGQTLATRSFEPSAQAVLSSKFDTSRSPQAGPSTLPTRGTAGSGDDSTPTVRLVDQPEPQVQGAASSNRSSANRPVQFREPPESPPPSQPQQAGSSSSELFTRPAHSRGNSYTNFSRPDAARHNNTKSPQPPNVIKTRNSITALPQRSSSISRTSFNKQNRVSGASTIASKRLRPPVHQADLEQGNDKHGSHDSAPVPPFPQGLTAHQSLHKKDDEPGSWLGQLYTISYLIFFAFLGTLARLGIEWLTYYPGAVITTPIVWANFAGSLFMGFLVEDARLFRDQWPDHISSTSRAEKRMSKQSSKSRRSVFSGDFDRLQRKERLKIKSHIPLYIGLTTGFCGCFTSFSLFARDMFLAVSNDLPAPPYQPNSPLAGYNIARSGGYSFMALLAVIITELTLSIGGFIAGRQLALLFEDYTPRISLRFTSKILDKLVVILGWGCWLGSIFLMIWPPDRPGGSASVGSWSNEYWRGVALFSMVFCPVGCLLRYYMGLTLNKLEPSFPLGTFAANLLGAAVLAACYDIQRIGIGDGSTIGGGLLSCQALEGLIDGFTGCLTTVSTFVGELDALRRKYAWIYGMSTVVFGFCLMVVIMGPVRWTVGWSNPACIVGYPNKYS